MDYITVKTDSGYDITINVEDIVSFYDAHWDGLEKTRISLKNSEYVKTASPISKPLRQYLSRLGYNTARIGE